MLLGLGGPPPVTLSGNEYVLTFQDDLSKYVVAVPMDRHDAETVAMAFVERIVLQYGTLQVIQTEQGANFMREVLKNTCCLLKIKKIQSTAFHPESQSSIERSHRILAEFLRHYVNEDQTNWETWIPFATYVYNSATNYTPFELMFGRLSTLPSALKKPPSPQYNHEDYVSELRGRLQSAHQQVHKRLLESKANSKEQYDKNARLTKFQVGGKVLLFDETARRGRSRSG
jgi:hypothetical protein